MCLRGVPVLAETSVLAAGMQCYPLRQFLLVTTLANAGLALAYAAIGSLLVEQNALLATILASMVLPGLFLGTRSLFKSRLAQPRYDQAQSLEGRFQVSYHYPVLFTDHIFQADNPCLHQQLTRQNPGRTTVLVFVDEQLLLCSPQLPLQIDHYFSAHAADLHLQAAPIAVPAGELSKTPDVLQQLYAQMLEHGLDRHCYVLALGGGAVLDAVGYACATFHRGMRLIRIPSTVLAQNDAGIGVKNGINAFAQKNLLGAFYPATAVINDFQLLLSLSHRDQIAGLAEAVKVAVIKDAAFFQWMEQQAEALAGFEHNASRYAIRRCAELHLGHITGAGDPFERGNGRPLDYGHWAAHKLENLSQHRLRHGEAVAVGMALDALYANASGLLSDADCQRLLRLLDRLGFNLCPPELSLRDNQGRSPILVGLEEFRQHLGGPAVDPDAQPPGPVGGCAPDRHAADGTGPAAPGGFRRAGFRLGPGVRAMIQSSLTTWLTLGRVSNLPTVWTNALAAALLASSATTLAPPSPLVWTLLLVALSALYLAGMLLNDLMDATGTSSTTTRGRSFSAWSAAPRSAWPLPRCCCWRRWRSSA